MLTSKQTKRTIIFYRKPGGQCSIQEFLDSLPPKNAQKVTWVLKLVEDLDRIPSQYFKKLLGTEIWECRIKLGSNNYRIFCFFLDKSVVVLTHGIVKKSMRVPRTEIIRAQAYRNDFIKRRKLQ